MMSCRPRRKWKCRGSPTSSRPREKSMSDFLIEHTPSAYRYPLLIKHLLHAPMTQSADQEIVYRDLSRYTYRDLRERIGRLASGLTSKGVRRGDVVGVLDWDSHRYLESILQSRCWAPPSKPSISGCRRSR